MELIDGSTTGNRLLIKLNNKETGYAQFTCKAKSAICFCHVAGVFVYNCTVAPKNWLLSQSLTLIHSLCKRQHSR